MGELGREREVERRGWPQGLTLATGEGGLRENTCIFRTGLHPRRVGSDLSAQQLLLHPLCPHLNHSLTPVCFTFSLWLTSLSLFGCGGSFFVLALG